MLKGLVAKKYSTATSFYSLEFDYKFKAALSLRSGFSKKSLKKLKEERNWLETFRILVTSELLFAVQDLSYKTHQIWCYGDFNTVMEVVISKVCCV